MTITTPTIVYAMPYAGGNSLVYRKLKQLLEPAVQLVALEPPGRGKRMKEPLLTDVNEIAQDAYAQIETHSDGREFALLGHSMGALVAYLVSLLSENEKPGHIKHLFCSAHGAPSVPKVTDNDPNPRYKASSEEFWAYIESLGALPPELKAHEELMSYFEPIVRADIQALECYRYLPTNKPLQIPITVFYGTTDSETPVSALLHWQRESIYPVHYFPQQGGHFGFFEQIETVAQKIRETVSNK
jgi:surfactin synthase thioesterase subunit